MATRAIPMDGQDSEHGSGRARTRRGPITNAGRSCPNVGAGDPAQPMLHGEYGKIRLMGVQFPAHRVAYVTVVAHQKCDTGSPNVR